MTDVDASTAHATALTPEPRNTAQELKVAVNTKRLSETIDKLFRNDGRRQGRSNTKSIKDMMPSIIIKGSALINNQAALLVCMPKETNVIPRGHYKEKLHKMLE